MTKLSDKNWKILEIHLKYHSLKTTSDKDYETKIFQILVKDIILFKYICESIDMQTVQLLWNELCKI